MTPIDELYIVEKVWPGAKAIGTALNAVDNGFQGPNETYPVVCTHDYEGRPRVFGTSLGHAHETWSTNQFKELVTRGFRRALKKQPIAIPSRSACFRRGGAALGQGPLHPMKFGVNTFIWGATFGPSDFHLLPEIKANGFDGSRCPSSIQPRSMRTPSGASSTGSVSSAPLSPSFRAARAWRRLMPASVNGVHASHACIAAARDARRDDSCRAHVHTGRLSDRPPAHVREWKWVVDSWQRLAPAVHAAGIEIALEPLNRFETYFLNTVADATKLCDAIGDPAIGILLDTFHANIEEKSIGDAVRHAAPHLKHLHTCENDRGTPGSGHVAWQEFFSAVDEIGYDRWLTIESFGFALGPLSAAAAIWRDLAPTPETIAFSGVKFLRAQALRAHSIESNAS